METSTTIQETYSTTYAVAASWGGCETILCNNVAYIDENLFDETIGYEPISYEDEDEEEEGYEEDRYPEIYQFYLTNCSEDYCRFLNEHFGLMFAYSEILDLWVLLVDHCGTSWDYVEIETDLATASAPLGTVKLN